MHHAGLSASAELLVEFNDNPDIAKKVSYHKQIAR